MAIEEKQATVTCPSCLSVNRVNLDRAADRPRCGNCDTLIPLDQPVRVTDETFEQTIKGTDVPVVVDFYADWCQPCKMMAPLLEQLASDMAGQLLVAKLDTDSNPTMAVHYGIRGIPTLVIFKDGREWKRQTGVVPPDRLAELLQIDVEIDEE